MPLISATAAPPASSRSRTARGDRVGDLRPRPGRARRGRPAAPRSPRAAASGSGARVASTRRRSGRGSFIAAASAQPRPRLAELLVLAPQRVLDVLGGDHAAVAGGEVRGRERGGLDVAAGQLGRGERVPVELRRARPRAGTSAARAACAARASGSSKRIDEAQPAQERLVDRGCAVGRQDDEAGERLDPLQQVVDLEVGVAVVRVADLGALAEQRVGLVEEQHRAAALGLVEGGGEVLLGLADVLRDDRREVDRGRGPGRARAASASAAIVLPVPGGPANSAATPWPRGSRRRKPQSSSTTCWSATCATSSRSLRVRVVRRARGRRA